MFFTKPYYNIQYNIIYIFLIYVTEKSFLRKTISPTIHLLAFSKRFQVYFMDDTQHLRSCTETKAYFVLIACRSNW